MDEQEVSQPELTLAFYPGFEKQEREDIKDWMLYAQNEADRRIDRDRGWREWGAWVDTHGALLVQTGGYMNSKVITPNRIITSLGEHFDFDFEIEGRFGEDLFRLGRKSREMTDLDEMVRLISDFLNGRAIVELGRFQTVICDKNTRGQIVLLVCGLQLFGELKAGSALLGTPERRRVILSVGGGGYVFSPQDYSVHRESIRRTLISHLQQRVKLLQISD